MKLAARGKARHEGKSRAPFYTRPCTGYNQPFEDADHFGWERCA